MQKKKNVILIPLSLCNLLELKGGGGGEEEEEEEEEKKKAEEGQRQQGRRRILNFIRRKRRGGKDKNWGDGGEMPKSDQLPILGNRYVFILIYLLYEYQILYLLGLLVESIRLHGETHNLPSSGRSCEKVISLAAVSPSDSIINIV